jgi:hypothetical protein
MFKTIIKSLVLVSILMSSTFAVAADNPADTPKAMLQLYYAKKFSLELEKTRPSERVQKITAIYASYITDDKVTADYIASLLVVAYPSLANASLESFISYESANRLTAEQVKKVQEFELAFKFKSGF